MLYYLQISGKVVIRMKKKTNQTWDIRGKKEIIGILMESAFYFELSLEERELLIKNIIAS
ncbi:MAG: hypothetical protein V3V59_08920 [Thermodesulfovibrionales bacterium]